MIVPKVNVSAGDGYSSAWIGIGGELEKSLIQVGTEQDVVNGQDTYTPGMNCCQVLLYD